MTFYAHTAVDRQGKPDPDEGRWQKLVDHLKQVAGRARAHGLPLGADVAREAELAGWLHDLGKYAGRFQARLRDPSIHGINHWAAGATQAAQVRARAVAFAVDGHHTGMPKVGELQQTVRKMQQADFRVEFSGCAEAVEELLARMQLEAPTPPAPPLRPAGENRFEEAMRARMIFSCLVDADFQDTEAHFRPGQVAERVVPGLQEGAAAEILNRHLTGKGGETELNQRRRQLLAECREAAKLAPGLFTLTAPTGSGKTLSSLAFALEHARQQNQKLPSDSPERFRRVIVVIPYTSIIEQTAEVYRGLFEPEFGPDYVLEHHSAVAPREQAADAGRDGEEARLRRARLAAENWESPVVVTTSVQFFESLFSHQPSACRKLHNIGRAIVLFDEVQTLPKNLIPSLLSAVRLLTRDYGATAVFMSATQPAFGELPPEALPFGWEPRAIARDEGGLAAALRRTNIQLPGRDQTTTWEAVAGLMAAERQALCVVNTTADAAKLFALTKQLAPEGVFHLSSRMCPQHRREKLGAIRRRLAAGEPCRLISTQLIEAGVDVDFPVAFRALGPLDAIIQTAGRCNREGKLPAPGPVMIFRPEEHRLPPGAYRAAAGITEAFLNCRPQARDQLHLPQLYADYFREMYGLLGPQAAREDPAFLASETFDFPAAAAACSLIAEGTQAVLVKWTDQTGRNPGGELAQKLVRERHLTAADYRLAQRYSVNLYPAAFREAQARGYVYQPAKEWDLWVWNSQYDEAQGWKHPALEDFHC